MLDCKVLDLLISKLLFFKKICTVNVYLNKAKPKIMHFLSTANTNFFKKLYYCYCLFLSHKLVFFHKKISSTLNTCISISFFQCLLALFYFYKRCHFFFMRYFVFQLRFV